MARHPGAAAPSSRAQAGGGMQVAGRVLAIHGVAPEVDPRRFAFRNLSDADSLRRFLQAAPPLVPLPEALAGRGNALTIDDATRAAADAALMARELGHAVSLFVNPSQVSSREQHYFLLLNVLLDRLDGQTCEFEGTKFETATMAQRQVLRHSIKARFRAMRDDRGRMDFVSELATRWRASPLELPEHFQTLGIHDLIALRDSGVDVQNHGWSHVHHPSLSSEQSVHEIREGRAWLQRELGVDAAYFAVPFGDALPTPEAAAACETWFTATDQLAPGWIGLKVFNREELHLHVTAGSSRALRPPPRRFGSGWIARLVGFLRTQ
jgi:hypothetical protein